MEIDMDAYEYSELLKQLSTKVENIENIIKPKKCKARIEEIELIEQDPSFWSDAKKHQKYLKRKKD